MPLELQRLPSTRELRRIAYPVHLEDTLGILSDAYSDGNTNCRLRTNPTQPSRHVTKNCSADANPSHDTSCPFFDILPREIRNEIYRHALGSSCDAFMVSKAHLRVTYQGQKGFIRDTYKDQITWMCSSKQMYREATEQFYHLARFNMDMDTRYDVLHAQGLMQTHRKRRHPTISRARFLTVMNLTTEGVYQEEGSLMTLQFNTDSMQYETLARLFPRMVELRQIEIRIDLRVPALYRYSSAECKPSLPFLRSLPLASMARLRVEIEYVHPKCSRDNVINRLTAPLKEEVARYVMPAVRGDSRRCREWQEQVEEDTGCSCHGQSGEVLIHSLLRVEMRLPR